jgi:DNA-binding CsgD family transcriptional regulator
MVTLDHQRVDTIVGVLQRCGQAVGVDAFRRAAVDGLHDVVACSAVAYNEVSINGAAPVTLIEPSDITFADADAVLATYAQQNPLITHYVTTRDPRAAMFSDFMTLDELRATDLYNLLYRRMDVDRQMAIALPSFDHLVIGLTVNRSGDDFTEEDRLALNIVRPHLAGLFHHAVAAAGLTAALEDSGAGVVVVDGHGVVVHATTLAEFALRRWFEPDDSVASRLPAILLGWLRDVRTALNRPTLHASVQPYTAQRDGTTLTVAYLSTVSGHDVLRINEHRDGLTADDVRGLGLTPRQADVLVALARGLTNAEIARDLDLRPATVRKHIEHVFVRLGVYTRAEAVAVAYREARRPS